VDLSFTAVVDEFHVSVRDSTGTPVAVGRAERVGPDRLRQRVSIAGPGAVTVAYHVTFTGGGTLTGTLRFGVGDGVAAAGREPAAAGGHGHDVDPLSAVLLILDGAVAVGAVLLLMLRPRRPTAPGQPAP
jgi:hypothetical protein